MHGSRVVDPFDSIGTILIRTPGEDCKLFVEKSALGGMFEVFAHV